VKGRLGALPLTRFIMHSCQTMKALNAPKKGKKPSKKKAQRKFYMSVIKVTVLSEGSPLTGDIELKDVDYMMSDGDCVGEVELLDTCRISRKEIVHALNSMNSQPGFFGLDDKGKDIRE
jgi:hypothetical protein